MTVTPLLCVWFASDPKPGKAQEAYDSRFYNMYRETLGNVLQRPALFFSGVGLLLLVSLWGFQFVPKIFFPASERTQLQVIIDRPIGTNSAATTQTVANLNAWLLDKEKNPEIASTIAYVASGGPRFYLSLDPVDPDPHRAFMVVNTVDAKSVPVLIRRITEYGFSNIAEARVQVKPLSLGPGEAGLVEYRVSGPGADELKRISDKITAGLRAIPGTLNIRDDWENRWVKIVVRVDQARARRVGVSSEDIARSLNAILSGREITDYREGDTSIPVVIRAERAQRTNLGRLRTLTIPTADNGSVPLLQIATVDAAPEFSLIQRRNLRRTITISGKHATLTAVELNSALQKVLSKLDLKTGYAIEAGGEIESSQKAQGSLFKYMPLALALIVLILVGQFGSFRKTAIVLTVIPLSIAGITAGLLLAPGSVFSFMAMLGMLSLAGIIINNAIVLIDRIDTERAAGAGLHDAIIDACLKRARPILMTTVTTVLGLSPLIIWRDILFYDLAVVIAGGLAVGTLLTLAVVPVLYALLFREPETGVSTSGAKAKAKA